MLTFQQDYRSTGKSSSLAQLDQPRVGSRSFEKTPLTKNEMCTTILKEMHVRQSKIEVMPWSYNRILGIFNTIADTPTMPVQTHPKFQKSQELIMLFNVKKEVAVEKQIFVTK